MYQTQQKYCNNRKQYLLIRLPFYIHFLILFYIITQFIDTLFLTKSVLFRLTKLLNSGKTMIHVHDFFHVFNNSIRQLTKILYWSYEPRRWTAHRTG